MTRRKRKLAHATVQRPPEFKLPDAAASALRLPLYIRLPPQEETDPIFGLSRGKLSEMILPQPWRPVPPVKSLRLPGRGKSKRQGVRLIIVSSLQAYLKKLESEQVA